MNKIYTKAEQHLIDNEAIKELDSIKNRSCFTCKFKYVGSYGICPIREPLIRQWLDYDEETFSCNYWKAKE